MAAPGREASLVTFRAEVSIQLFDHDEGHQDRHTALQRRVIAGVSS